MREENFARHAFTGREFHGFEGSALADEALRRRALDPNASLLELPAT